MPGANCSIFGCPTSRRNKDISIFKVPLPNSEANKKWRSELINIITKDRVVDDALKKRIAGSNLFICEQHFSTDQFYIYPTRKSLKEGALPTLTLFMPGGGGGGGGFRHALLTISTVNFLKR